MKIEVMNLGFVGRLELMVLQDLRRQISRAGQFGQRRHDLGQRLMPLRIDLVGVQPVPLTERLGYGRLRARRHYLPLDGVRGLPQVWPAR